MPTTTTGVATEFITFSRPGATGGGATVTDSDGKIKWAPHNLLLNSESFDESAWTKSAGVTTVTANAVAAPNGTQTADLITSGIGDGSVYQVLTLVAGVTYTFSVWLKAQSPSSFSTALQIYNPSDTGTTQTITVTSDWQMFSLTKTVTQSGGYFMFIGGSSTLSNENLYAWGAALYRSDLGGMQPNTSAYPTYNPTTPKNLLGYTESLTTGWTNTNTTDAIVSEINPVGLTGAVDVAATAGNGTLLSSLTLVASPYTFSIWLKRKTGSGTVEITVDGTTYVAAAVTGTWTRFSTTLTPSGGSRTPGIRLVTSGDAVYAWGAQLSDSASLDTYAPVYGAAVTSAAYYGPRRDFNGSTLACNGLLVEEQRTNLVPYSNTLDISGWSQSNVSVATAAGISPTGTNIALKLKTDTNPSTHAAYFNVASSVVGSNYTASAYVKAGEYNFAVVGDVNVGYVYVNLTTGDFGTIVGSIVSKSAVSVGNNWWRVSVTTTAASNSGPLIGLAPANGGLATAGLNNTDGIYVYGPQWELGSFSTSFIPTIGNQTATRNADVASVSAQAFPYGASEGTLVANASWAIAPVATVTNQRIAFMGSPGDPYARTIQRQDSSATGVTLHYRGASSAVNIATSGNTAKSGLAWSSAGGSGSVNGSAASALTGTPTTSDGLPINILRIGNAGDSTFFNGHILQITYLPRRVTNAELQTRTA